MKPVICLEPLYPGLTITEKIAHVAGAGFDTVEFWNWRDKSIPELLAGCQQHHVQVSNFAGHRAGSAIAADTHAELLADISGALAAARQLGCRKLMLTTNALNSDGSVVDSYAQIPDAQKYENTLAALRKILAAAPEDIHFVLEPLNIVVDHPGYYLTDMKTAVALVHEIGSPRLQVLCDLYHLGMMGYDPEQIVSDYCADIGHFHIADFPGRHEPGTGSANWLSILLRIQQMGYTGTVGFEYYPQGDSDESLNRVRALWQRL
jgi:hydroxypyruvate isomerase